MRLKKVIGIIFYPVFSKNYYSVNFCKNLACNKIVTKLDRFLAGSLPGKLGLYYMAVTAWESSGLTRDRTGSTRKPAESIQDEVHCRKLTGN